MKIFILTTETRDKLFDATIKSLKENGFDTNDIFIVYGIVRNEKTSKIVMDSWKEFFQDYKEKILCANQDILLMEDDVKVLVSKDDLLSKINMEKVNLVFYQKYLKYANIFVGCQGIYIPQHLVSNYIDKLLISKSMHFDRWNSRYIDLHYTYKPKEGGIEYEHESFNLKGRVRKGIKL